MRCDCRRRLNLESLVERLRADSSIDVLEQAERELKQHLQNALAGPLDGEAIRALASLQQQIGFLPKYKSYAVKAASPLGYSVFLQRPGEGFSFQQHIKHKTELFYVLDVLPGGYVFLCDYEEWQRIYDRGEFLAWLGGRPDARYERWKLVPQPGDVIIIDKLNVVHSVIGCTLVEFATVSTDMVDRLYDQNQGRKIPAEFTRPFTEDRLRRLTWPAASQRVTFEGAGGAATTYPRIRSQGAFARCSTTGWWERRRFGSIRARRVISAQTRSGLSACTSSEGAGRLVLGDAAEVRRSSPPALAARAGDLFFVAPGAHYGFINDGAAPLTVAEHRIPVAVAFV